ncbi:uroporphyrinogen decarboxylase family protein [Candidatus Poribacteria bacterium]
MTCKERVYQALSFQESDVIPYNISVEASVAERLDEHYGGRDKWPKYENHFAGTGWSWHKEDVGKDLFRDPFGVVWHQGTIFEIVEPILKEPDLTGFQWPELVTDDDIPRIEKFCENQKDKFTIYGLGLIFFERAWALRGMENILMDFVIHTEFVEELLDKLMQLQLDALDKILHLPMDCIRFGDDFGAQRGLIMGQGYWCEFLKPRLAKMYGKARDAGKFVEIHSCGDNTEIMEDLIEIGVQILNPFQPEANDIFEMKRLYGRRITFNGGIGTQVTLPHGTPEEVREEIRTCASVLSKDGGYVMETTKPIRPEVPTENAVAALETIIAEAHRAQK